MHPARAIPFPELHAALQAEVVAGSVRMRSRGDLRLFVYTEACNFDKKWNDVNRLARGLILDVAEEAVVATPFPKFFNYGELGQALPEESFRATEKMDGSLGILYFYAERWQVATKGSFDSEQARWAEAWLDEQDTSPLVPGATYLTEIIYPENRIVVPYDYSGLVLLAAYDEAGEELPPEALAGLTLFRQVPAVEYAFDDLLRRCRELPASQEGFVVRFASGLRVKVKGDEYCRIHRLLSNITPLGIYELLLNRDDLTAVKAKLPEEFWRDFDTLTGLLQDRLAAALDLILGVFSATSHLSNKELGLLQATEHGFAPHGMKFVFQVRKLGGFDAFERELQTGDCGPTSTRRKVFETFRPTGNRLEGYAPSGAMTRFVAESG